jgi:hypothetical protein
VGLLLQAIVNGRENGRWVLFRWAAIIYASGTLLHTLDHLRRGTDVVTSQVLWAGTVSTPIDVVVIFLALAGYRYAPVLAVAFGFSHAIGIAAVHLLPHWGVFSDSLTSNSGSPISYVAVLAEIIGALCFSATGLYVLLGGQRARPPMLTGG